MMASAAQVRQAVLVVTITFVAVVGFIWFNFANRPGVPGDPGLSTKVSNLVVTIGDRTFTMFNGFAAQEAVSGSAAQNTVRIIGEPAPGDANRDGYRDAALLIENDLGGNGRFYYAVLAVDENGSYRATNALLMGDRIAPRTVDFLDWHFVYNYLARQSGEPMTADPSVTQSLWIRFDKASGVISAG